MKEFPEKWRKKKEAVLGIPLTLLVFSGVLSGWADGVVTWAARRCSLTEASPFGKRWYLLTSIISYRIFFIGCIGLFILYRIYEGCSDVDFAMLIVLQCGGRIDRMSSQ